MICSNCLEERDDVILICEQRKYCACSRCTVTYGKDRYGETYFPGEAVYVKDGVNYTQLRNRLLTIIGIYIFEECESGRMVWCKDNETQKPLKIIFDINWLIKVNKN